jgi:hypothetical protein
MRLVVCFVIGQALVCVVGTRQSEAASARTIAAPRLQAIAVAPTEIRLAVELPAHSLDISATGGPEGETPRSWFVSLGMELHEGRYTTHGRTIVSARPDTTYRFRARAQVTSGSRTEPRESNECVVKTPPEPSEPPPTPSGIAIAAPSPFTLEVRWRYAGAPAYGFEIQRRNEAGNFARIGIAEPDARRFVDHGRRPATSSTYRVRAFNPRGASSWSATASGPTRRLAELSPPIHKEPRGACTTLDAEIARITADASVDGTPAKTQVCKNLALDDRHHVDAVTVPVLCGVQNCGWTLYGAVDGCYRALGSFSIDSSECPRFDAIAVGKNGWPVLRAYAHESAAASRVAVHVFLDGRYVDVDGYVECSPNAPVAWTADREKPEDDPMRWAPPFTGCWQQ